MGGGNGQKAKQRQARNAKKKEKKGGGSQLADNQKAMNVVCKICRQSFMCTVKPAALNQHAENKHPKLNPSDCFDTLAETATAMAS